MMDKKRIPVSLGLSVLLVAVVVLCSACQLHLDKLVPAAAACLCADSGAELSDTKPAAVSGSQSMALPGIADVVAAVKPSVVAIDTETGVQVFHRSFTQEGAGSGWIVSPDGIIVTNNHVVAGAQRISVTLDDGRVFAVDPNTVRGDPLNDLAVLRIDAENLPAAVIGDSSSLRVGDWVVSIGNPLGLGISAKEGIVSRLDVSLAVEGPALDHFIETSAAINPGNSGGPLANMRGEVVGITSAKISSVGVEGLGYAIGIDDVMSAIERLIERS